MDNISGFEYITIDGYVEVHKYGSLCFVIMFIVYALIICSNSLIVCVIWMHPKLHEPMYIFIAALCLNSILYSTTIYPKILIDFLSEKQVISYPACLFQLLTYYNLVGSEFLLLAAMAYDWYVSICKPLQYSTIMKKTNVRISIALAWLYPVLLTLVQLVLNAKKKLCRFIFKGIICNSLVYALFCVSSTALNTYGFFIFVHIVIVPLLFILYTYSRIFIIANRNSKEMKRKAAETCLPHLLVLINLTVFSTYDVLLLRIETEFSKTVRFIVTLQMIIYHPLLNPLVYGLKMKEINKHIKKLLSSILKNK